MKYTPVEKKFLTTALYRNDILALLSSAYCDDDKVSFKEQYGCTFKQAQNAINKLIKNIIKD